MVRSITYLGDCIEIDGERLTRDELEARIYGYFIGRVSGEIEQDRHFEEFIAYYRGKPLEEYAGAG